MVVIEGLKDGPVKGKSCILTLFGEGGVIQHFKDKSVAMGKWKALEPHGRLIDGDSIRQTIISCIKDAEKEYTSEDLGLVKMVYESCLYHIEQAQTVLEASNGDSN